MVEPAWAVYTYNVYWQDEPDEQCYYLNKVTSVFHIKYIFNSSSIFIFLAHNEHT